jgi:hypothetical protein
MEIKRGILVLADISGYTRFTRMHFTSLLHAEEIISELLEAVIAAAEFPLQVSQLEGDAVLLFAETKDGQEAKAASDVARQIRQLFTAFNARERALIACDAGCVCDACNQIGQLKLKAVLHFGQFSLERILSIEALAGADLGLVRTLIKAPVLAPEFILMTPRFYELAGKLGNRPPDRQIEIKVLEETIPVVIYFPGVLAMDLSIPPGSGPMLSGRLNQHAFARMFHLKQRAHFSHLAGGGMNLVRYLLEGMLSGINLLRKGLRNFRRQENRPMEIRPVALILMEVSADPSALNRQGPSAHQTEQIITEILRNVLDSLHIPLTLNKLEGNAAFLYAVADNGNVTVARNVAWQAIEFFKVFRASEAIRALRFRVLLHFGQAAFKNVRQFEEIAGEDVILIHRLLKNSISFQEYVLMTERFHRLSGGLDARTGEMRLETAEGLGQVAVRVFPFARAAERNEDIRAGQP